MQEKIITIYCLCADFLIAYGHKDDPQAHMSTAEVMTTALVATWFYQGNQEYARLFLKEHAYIPNMLSKSRFNRRLHAIADTLWQALFSLLAAIHKQTNTEQDYIIDSCPVAVCDNMRIKRCKIYRSEEHRGYCASKRRYFYGLKAHLIVTATGKPVEVVLSPGAMGDMPGFRSLFLDLPEGADLYGDKGYTDYEWEDLLVALCNIELTAARKKNSKRPHPGHIGYLCQVIRKRVETTFSQITEHLARSIHAVTPRGFELKVFLTILAYSILG
jgi:transposase